MVLHNGPVIRAPAFYNNGSRYLSRIDQGVNLLDDQFLELGTDQDGVITLSSAAVAADAEVTGIIEGTSDHLGHAAASIVISDITDDGDVHILVSKGGNSHTAFLADGSTGDTILNASSGQSVDLYVAGAVEYDFSASSADFNANTIDDVGTISATNAAGPSVINLAATTTVPTLVPNRTETDTGIGWASDTLHIVLGGANEYSFSATDADFNSNTLSNVGNSGNDFAANTWQMNSSNNGGQNTIQTRNSSGTSNSEARFVATVVEDSGDAYFRAAREGGGAVMRIGIDTSAGGGDPVLGLIVWGRGDAMGTDDIMRVTNASPPVVTYNTTHPTGTFDYVCGQCGRHEAEIFTCCGSVEWHDDVMDFRAMALRDPDALDYMERVGVIEQTLSNEGDPEIFTVLGKDFEFAMSAAFQNRQRMDAQYEAMDERIARIEQAIGV